MRAETFVELARRHGVSLRYKAPVGSDRNDGTDPFRFNGLAEFLYLFAAVCRSLRDVQDFARLAAEFVRDALAQGVIYGELFVSPSVWTFFNPNLDVRAAIEAIAGELRAARPRATFKLLPDLTRNFGPESAMQTARLLAGMTDLDVIGVSLGGDEIRFPAALFADAFAYARAHGLRCVAHAGETGGAASVRDAVGVLRAERIGHGIAALQDPKVLEMLGLRGIALEVCPTSNARTGTMPDGQPNAFLELDRAGCIVTIDADDPSIFASSIGREYALVEEVAGPEALLRYVRNAIRASFATEAEKRTMESHLAAAIAEPPVASRS